MLDHLTELENQFAAELRPGTPLERLITSEIAYAAWELSRVRANRAHTDAAPSLHAAFNRASRNWTRASKELHRLQTARTNRLALVVDDMRETYSHYTLLDPKRIPIVKHGDKIKVFSAFAPFD